MKRKSSTIYVCSNCGEEYHEWEGRCRNCGQWNTLKKFEVESSQFSGSISGEVKETVKLDQIAPVSTDRLQTGFTEFDRVLGGGIVLGSVVLLGGDPGIGKSTLLLQIAAKLADDSRKILYISGEESVNQIRIRAQRLALEKSSLEILNETSVPNILETIESLKPNLVIIDSIQTLYLPDFPSTPGSLVQVRESSLRLQQFAKKANLAIILVGHITKEGVVAGPKTLEHLVDVVLYLEGERYHNIRILRGVKNRFGDIAESGIFEMTGEGFIEVSNPSKLFLAERVNAPGSVIAVTLEGRRPILVEIQALVKKTAFGYPKRTASGFDLNRLQLLLAVLGKRAGLNLENDDVYVNVVGGLKIKEPAADLAVIAAIASVKNNLTIDDELVVWGEVGLAGEIRNVTLEKDREAETKRLGYQFSQKQKTIREFLDIILLTKK